jgi:hypothetical protein
MPLQGILARSFGGSAQVQNIVFLVALVVCFFGPVLLFVIGTRYISFGWRDLGAKSYWSELWQVTIRALHWLIGAGVSFAVLSTLGI